MESQLHCEGAFSNFHTLPRNDHVCPLICEAKGWHNRQCVDNASNSPRLRDACEGSSNK